MAVVNVNRRRNEKKKKKQNKTKIGARRAHEPKAKAMYNGNAGPEINPISPGNKSFCSHGKRY